MTPHAPGLLPLLFLAGHSRRSPRGAQDDLLSLNHLLDEFLGKNLVSEAQHAAERGFRSGELGKQEI